MLILELGFCLVLLLLSICGLPIPSESSIASLGVDPIAYSRRELSPPDDRSSAAGYSPVGRPQVWGGTPATTSICVNPSLWTGKWRSAMIFIVSALIFFYGLLAFVMWGVMSIDLPRLMVWNRTGDEKRRVFAGKVLKVRNRPDWLLLSLVLVSVAIAEALPYFWSHLFAAGDRFSSLANNAVILVSQVGPVFVMPVFHLEVSGRFTWFVRLVMWFSAPVTVLPAYALRRLKQWKHCSQQAHMDGLLPLNELTEFIHLHEKGQGYGGTLDDHVGKAMRSLLEAQISLEVSGGHVELEGSRSIQTAESIRLTSIQSLYQEGSTAVETDSTNGPTSIHLHRQEGSTATEDLPALGLRKRGERSTGGYEPVPSMPLMQTKQILTTNRMHRSPKPVNNEYVERRAPNRRLRRQEFPLQDSSNSFTPRRRRLTMMESYQNDRKISGLVTDSFLLEQG